MIKPYYGSFDMYYYYYYYTLFSGVCKLAVNVVLINGEVIHGRSLECVVGKAKAFIMSVLRAPPLSVTLINLLWYKVVDAEVNGKKLKEVLVPVTSILYIYEE